MSPVSPAEPSAAAVEPSSSSSSYRPFQCSVCHSRFTRHENLKRHASLHSRSANKATFPCDFCQVTFSRRDLRNRHVKRKHPEQDQKQAIEKPQHDSELVPERRDGSNSQEPMATSAPSAELQHGLYSQQSFDGAMLEVHNRDWQMESPPIHPQLGHRYEEQISNRDSPSMDVAEQADCNVMSWLRQQQPTNEPSYSNVFGSNVTEYERPGLPDRSGFTPDYEMHNQMYPTTELQSNLHDETSESGTPGQSIPEGLSLRDVPYLKDSWSPSASQTTWGYQLYFTYVSHFVPFLHRPTFDATEIAPHLGLSMLCLAYQYGEDPDCGQQAGSGATLSLRCFHRARVLAASGEEKTDSLAHNITLVQSYWLLQVCVMMYICGKESTYGFKMHARMISLTRFGGLTQPIPVDSTVTDDLDTLWHEFIKAESHKRTLLAVHQLDALWYQLFSIPRSLSHLEIKHDLPCREECWTASSSTQWATRQLMARQSTPSVPYSDAIRRFLSPNPDIETLPQFDLYGAINIAQFLLSSVREVSGWSTMTGRLSLERFEPLHASLVALDRLIRPHGKTANSSHATLCEATWEMAMIELQIWSLTHTSGIVGGSVDAFLQQSTHLAPSCEIPYESATAKAIQPHINWFLRHLETTASLNSNPPWITLYAYKAFLIAWQLVHEGSPGVMEVVGVQDGDLHGAVTWAKKVFRHEHHRQLSKLIGSCLDTLDR